MSGSADCSLISHALFVYFTVPPLAYKLFNNTAIRFGI